MKFKTLSTIGLTVLSVSTFTHVMRDSNPPKRVEVEQEIQVSNKSVEPVQEAIEQPQIKSEQEEVKELYFNSNDVTELSNMTVEQVQEVLEGTSLYPLASDYIELEKIYGINALFIVSLTIEESGWGTSRITHDNNNISGQRINGVYRKFKSKYACLKETYRLISEEYVNEEGKYYVGSSNIYDINATYCPDTEKDSWANNIIEISKNIQNKVM